MSIDHMMLIFPSDNNVRMARRASTLIIFFFFFLVWVCVTCACFIQCISPFFLKCFLVLLTSFHFRVVGACLPSRWLRTGFFATSYWNSSYSSKSTPSENKKEAEGKLFILTRKIKTERLGTTSAQNPLFFALITFLPATFDAPRGETLYRVCLKMSGRNVAVRVTVIDASKYIYIYSFFSRLEFTSWRRKTYRHDPLGLVRLALSRHTHLPSSTPPFGRTVAEAEADSPAPKVRLFNSSSSVGGRLH